jgi:hypothetical protein
VGGHSVQGHAVELEVNSCCQLGGNRTSVAVYSGHTYLDIRADVTSLLSVECPFSSEHCQLSPQYPHWLIVARSNKMSETCDGNFFCRKECRTFLRLHASCAT